MAPPQVNICVKNNLPADYTGGLSGVRTYIKYSMNGGYSSNLFGSSWDIRESGYFGRGGQKCEAFTKGHQVTVQIFIAESGGTYMTPGAPRKVTAPATIGVEAGSKWTNYK